MNVRTFFFYEVFMYIYFNPNPYRNLVGDCVVRAISKATGQTWEDSYLDIVMQGYMMKDMPSSNDVWDAYLIKKGYKRKILPNTCPDCYTIRDFCEEHPKGKYILATGSHVIAVENGNYYDTWDSGDETVVYYYEKENKK